MADENKLLYTCTNNIRRLRMIPQLTDFIDKLFDTNKYEVGVFGGAARDWYLDREPKDIDLVVSCSKFDFEQLVINFPVTKTLFGGYKFEICGVKFDMWRFQDSFVFLTGEKQASWQNLVESVLFNIDAIIVTLSGKIYEAGFKESLRTKTIDLYTTTSPRSEIFILKRALRFLKKYRFKPTDRMSLFLKTMGEKYHNQLYTFYGECSWLDSPKPLSDIIDIVQFVSSNEYDRFRTKASLPPL